MPIRLTAIATVLSILIIWIGWSILDREFAPYRAAELRQEAGNNVAKYLLSNYLHTGSYKLESIDLSKFGLGDCAIARPVGLGGNIVCGIVVNNKFVLAVDKLGWTTVAEKKEGQWIELERRDFGNHCCK